MLFQGTVLSYLREIFISIYRKYFRLFQRNILRYPGEKSADSQSTL